MNKTTKSIQDEHVCPFVQNLLSKWKKLKDISWYLFICYFAQQNSKRANRGAVLLFCSAKEQMSKMHWMATLVVSWSIDLHSARGSSLPLVPSTMHSGGVGNRYTNNLWAKRTVPWSGVRGWYTFIHTIVHTYIWSVGGSHSPARDAEPERRSSPRRTPCTAGSDCAPPHARILPS